MFLWSRDLPVSIHDAEVHGFCVKIDPAVMLVVLGVESHGSLLEWLVVVFQPAYSVWRRFEEGACMSITALKTDVAPRDSNRSCVMLGK
jgi:hypothetical protein